MINLGDVIEMNFTGTYEVKSAEWFEIQGYYVYEVREVNTGRKHKMTSGMIELLKKKGG